MWNKNRNHKKTNKNCQGIRDDRFKAGPPSILSLASFPFLFHAVRVGFGLPPPSWKKHKVPEAFRKMWKHGKHGTKNGTTNGNNNEKSKQSDGSGPHGDMGKKWSKQSDAKCTLQPNRKDIEVRMPRSSNPVSSPYYFHCVFDFLSASIPPAISK